MSESFETGPERARLLGATVLKIILQLDDDLIATVRGIALERLTAA
jgi:hypothetical protein